MNSKNENNSRIGAEFQSNSEPENTAKTSDEIIPKKFHDEGKSDLSDDLILKAEGLSTFMFGSKKYIKRIYHLRRTSRVPIFSLGGVLAGRRSVILAWIKAEEDKRRK